MLSAWNKGDFFGLFSFMVKLPGMAQGNGLVIVTVGYQERAGRYFVYPLDRPDFLKASRPFLYRWREVAIPDYAYLAAVC